jgi:flagellar protein FlgJ
MDVGALGGQYFEQSRYGVEASKLRFAEITRRAAAESAPVAGQSASAGQPAGSSAENSFARYLEAAQQKNTDAASSKKPVIDKSDKLYEQCMELETFLVKTLIKSMRSTVQKSELLDTGFAGEMNEDMLYDEYAKDITKNAGLGFADTAYLELTGQRGKLMSR